MTKMTKKVALGIAIEAIGTANDEAVEVLQNMIAQLEKRASAPKKPTKVQIANEGVKAEILTFLSAQEAPMGAKAIADAMGIEKWQKVSALLKQLKDDGAVVRTEEKGKALFAISTEVEG